MAEETLLGANEPGALEEEQPTRGDERPTCEAMRSITKRFQKPRTMFSQFGITKIQHPKRKLFVNL